jgi:hypothetical protein
MLPESLRRATVVRTKNAGPFHLTIDVFFDDEDAFVAARGSDDLDPAAVARAYGVDPAEVEGPFWDDTARGVKVTIPKRPASSSPSCTDILGAHLHLPLLLDRPDR